MDLLQNRRYKPREIPNSYFHEIRMLIESIIEVCHEGEISVHEAENIFNKELLSCFDYQEELWKKLYSLKNGIQESTEEDKNVETPYCEENASLFSPEEIIDLEEADLEEAEKIVNKWEIGDLEKALNDMEGYNNFLIEAQDKLDEIFDSADYNKKRKAKIKQQIIRDGLKLSPEMADNTNVRTSKMGITERSMNLLIFNFPELAKDYLLLFKHGFVKTTEKGLRKGDKTSKKFLTDYFKSIQPQRMKKIPWTMRENIFGEKDLKNSASNNGKKYKEGSEDFIKWLELRKNTADK
jgi:hypothetical protein